MHAQAKMRGYTIKRANDALEELLRHHSEAVELDPSGARAKRWI